VHEIEHGSAVRDLTLLAIHNDVHHRLHFAPTRHADYATDVPCLLAVGGLFLPRLIIILLAVFTHYFSVFDSFLWPLLGFFFLPTTTLAWAWALHTSKHAVQGVNLIIVILAACVDIGIIGGGRSRLARRRRA
jgi:hypothetical protein